MEPGRDGLSPGFLLSGTGRGDLRDAGERPDGPWLGYWPGPYGAMASTYDWVSRPNSCPAESANGRSRPRFEGHIGGHVFDCEILA